MRFFFPCLLLWGSNIPRLALSSETQDFCKHLFFFSIKSTSQKFKNCLLVSLILIGSFIAILESIIWASGRSHGPPKWKWSPTWSTVAEWAGLVSPGQKHSNNPHLPPKKIEWWLWGNNVCPIHWCVSCYQLIVLFWNTLKISHTLPFLSWSV